MKTLRCRSAVKLVIFDLDGVLVDTQDAENEALVFLAHLMGLTIDPRRAQHLFSGKRLHDCIGMLVEMSGSQAPPDAVAIVRDRCETTIGSDLRPVPGVVETLDRIAPIKVVASNSPREIIERRLAAAGIRHHFQHGIYSAYDANAWKPDPRLFRWASADHGVAAQDCVVIEDSAVGVDAAVTAGMPVLQFSNGERTAPHRHGVPVFTSMLALPDLINSLPVH